MFSAIENPVVSVCMITYNHESYLHDAILGVLNQIVSFPVEFIIADDCSPDNTTAVLDSPSIKNHPNYHWINYTRHDKNIGMIPNFLLASALCRGQYIALCEGDDYWTNPTKLQTQFDFMQANPSFSGCFHKVNIINQNKETIDVLPLNLTKTDFGFNDLVKGWFIPTSSLFYRNYKIHKAMVCFHNLISGDRLIVALLGDKGSLKYINETMGIYRKHPEGISTQYASIKVLKSNVNLFKQMLTFFKPRHKNVLQHQIFLWRGTLCREYLRNKNYSQWFLHLVKTAFCIRNYMDFKGYIKNYVLGKP